MDDTFGAQAAPLPYVALAYNSKCNGRCTLACSTLLLNDPLMDSDDMSHLPYNFCYIVRSL